MSYCEPTLLTVTPRAEVTKNIMGSAMVIAS